MSDTGAPGHERSAPTDRTTTAAQRSGSVLPTVHARSHRFGAAAFAVVAWALFGAVVLQVYLAGAGTFSNAAYLGLHRAWVLWFQDWPLLLFVLSFTFGMAWRTRVLILLLRGLIGAQFGLLELAPHFLAGLHTVNALAVAALSWYLARRGTQCMKATRKS